MRERLAHDTIVRNHGGAVPREGHDRPAATITVDDDIPTVGGGGARVGGGERRRRRRGEVDVNVDVVIVVVVVEDTP